VLGDPGHRVHAGAEERGDADLEVEVGADGVAAVAGETDPVAGIDAVAGFDVEAGEVAVRQDLAQDASPGSSMSGSTSGIVRPMWAYAGRPFMSARAGFT
jgi:hypothetical protein